MPSKFVFAALCCVAHSAVAATIGLTPFNLARLPANASNVTVNFVDGRGDVAGTYYDPATGLIANFALSATGAFSQIAAGGSISSVAVSGNYVGIGTSGTGQVCGIYSTGGLLAAPQTYCGSLGAATYLFSIDPAKGMVGQDGARGFVLAKGHETLLQAGPAGASTAATALNQGGEVVGTYTDASASTYGWARSKGGAITVLRRADGSTLLPIGITTAGAIYGGMFVNGAYSGTAFAYSGGAYTALNLPAAAVSSTVNSVSPGGRVVGTYTDASGNVAAYYRTRAGAVVPVAAPSGFTTGSIGSVTDSGWFVFDALGFDDTHSYFIGKCAGADC